MEGNNKIIQRILDDAERRCQEISAQAEEKSANLIAANEARLTAKRGELEADLASKGRAIVSNAIANSELEVKKYRLRLKRELLDQAYEGTYKKILGLSQAEYLALIERLLKAHAEKGEVVEIAKKDERVITQQFLDRLNLSLKLGGTCNIEGGVILRSQTYSKDLSIRSVLRAVRENTEMEIAGILFKA